MIEPLIGAIAVGNCGVLKPSEVVPNVSAVIIEIIETAITLSFYIGQASGGKSAEQVKDQIQNESSHDFIN